MKLNVGPKLLELRDQRRMSQAEFAEILAMSQSTYSRLERGETIPDLERLVRISEVLDFPLIEFLPEGLIFSNHHNTHQDQGHGGSIMAVYNYYGNKDEVTNTLSHDNDLLRQQVAAQADKIALLEEQVALPKRLLDK